MTENTHTFALDNLPWLQNVVKQREKTSQFFSGLSEKSLKNLLEHSIIQNTTAGRVLFEQGSTPSHVYYIIAGAVKTTRYGKDGDEAVIRMLRSGETFMEAVIFMGDVSPINAQTIEDTKLLLIPAQIVRRHALHDGQFSANLLRIVTQHYKNAMHQIDSITTKPPVQRIGYYLLKLLKEQGGDSMNIALPFKKSLIASHLGMKPETFSRALAQLKKRGIDIEGETITLHDAFSLCHFCDPDLAEMCAQKGTEKCPLH